MPEFKAIAAMASNRVIGKDQRLPWHIPEELSWFRQVTLHQTLLMGRKTFESMGCKALPQRTTYVLSSNQNVNFPHVSIIPSLSALEAIKGTVWVCGGMRIYEQFLPICSELILSVIKEGYEGDAFFPKFEHIFSLRSILKQTDKFEVQQWVRD